MHGGARSAMMIHRAYHTLRSTPDASHHWNRVPRSEEIKRTRVLKAVASLSQGYERPQPRTDVTPISSSFSPGPSKGQLAGTTWV